MFVQCTSSAFLRLAPLKIKSLADSKLAVWQREDLSSILAFENFDGAVEQDSKVRSLQSVFIFATLSMEQLKRRRLRCLHSRSFNTIHVTNIFLSILIKNDFKNMFQLSNHGHLGGIH